MRRLNSRPDYHVDWVEVGGVHLEGENYDRMGGNDPNDDWRGLYIQPMAAECPERFDVPVRIWDGDPHTGGVLLCEEYVGARATVIDFDHCHPGHTYEVNYIESGGWGELVCQWVPMEAGSHEIYDDILSRRDVLGRALQDDLRGPLPAHQHAGGVTGVCGK